MSVTPAVEPTSRHTRKTGPIRFLRILYGGCGACTRARPRPPWPRAQTQRTGVRALVSVPATTGRFLSLLVLALFARPGLAQVEETPLRFVVAGHLRGDPSSGQPMAPVVPEFVARCRRLDPALVFLAGDLVWGDYDRVPTDPDRVLREWEELDAALAPILDRVHRVPGNHDVNDLATRDLWNARYGSLPRAVRHGRCLFLLLASPWIPVDGDLRKSPAAKGQSLDPAQIRFLGEELGRGDHEHAFVILHHVLWWDPEGSWWRAVHPVLRDRRVRAVFAGDFGPKKFSHELQDGIHYLQVCFETDPNPEILRIDERSRVLSEPPDLYAVVEVRGPEVDIEVRALGALDPVRHSSRRWREVHDLSPQDYIRYNVLDTTPRKRKLALLLLGMGAALGVAATLLALWVLHLVRRRRRS
jgi:hypothetical protein